MISFIEIQKKGIYSFFKNKDHFKKEGRPNKSLYNILEGEKIEDEESFVQALNKLALQHHNSSSICQQDLFIFLFHGSNSHIKNINNSIYKRCPNFLILRTSSDNLEEIFFVPNTISNINKFNEYIQQYTINLLQNKELKKHIEKFITANSQIPIYSSKNHLKTISVSFKKVNFNNLKTKEEIKKELTLDHNVKSHDKTLLIKSKNVKLNFNSFNENIDSRQFFYDSSIWFRFHPESLQKYPKGYDESSYLKKLEQEFNINKKWLLLPSSEEYKKFQQRLCEASYVESRLIRHNTYITPFKFHSETACFDRSLTLKEMISTMIDDSDEWHWNILIIDDHAEQCLFDNIMSKEYTKKSRIIECLELKQIKLNHYKLNLSQKKEINLHIKTLDQLPDYSDPKIKAIIDNADIILFDYLFRTINHSGNKTYERSNEIIKSLYEMKGRKTNGMKHWIIPISAYNFAFLDMLKLKHISFYNENIILSDGSDPICQPHLFTMKFFEFILLQLKEFASYKNNKNVFKDNLKTLTNTTTKDELTEKAKKLYPVLFRQVQQFKQLVNDKNKNQSGFTNSLLENFFPKKSINNFYSDKEIELLNRFLYIIAYEISSAGWILDDIYQNAEDGGLKVTYEKLLNIIR